MSANPTYVDAHIHCYEIDVNELEKYIEDGFRFVCVSDDIDSSYETLRLAENNNYITPCIGIHPWLIDSVNKSSFFKLLEEKIDLIKCIGEVGLDKKFKSQTFQQQIVFFDEALRYAKEYDLVLNIHAAGAWREVYNRLVKIDIEKAYIHWYSGPIDLMNTIIDSGYYIGLNPAWVIQDKHRVVAEKASIDKVLTESDAPYRYRGLMLKPILVKETVSYVAKTRGVSLEEVIGKISRNYNLLFKS